MPADYDCYLNNLYELIEEDIDFTQPAASISSRIILGKLLEFRDNGTYESATNVHLMHDCETEGCHQTAASSEVEEHHQTTASSASEKDGYRRDPDTSLKEKDEVNWSSMTTAEIIAYLDNQRTTSVTQFDIQHPTIYFDQDGRACGSDVTGIADYYATRNGEVYKLNGSTDIDRMNENMSSDISQLGTYVGETTRRIK